MGSKCSCYRGDRDYFGKIFDTLTNLKIPVNNSYVDGFVYGLSAFFPFGRGKKDLVAVPETGKAIMYSEPLGYLQLAWNNCLMEDS